MKKILSKKYPIIETMMFGLLLLGSQLNSCKEPSLSPLDTTPTKKLKLSVQSYGTSAPSATHISTSSDTPTSTLTQFQTKTITPTPSQSLTPTLTTTPTLDLPLITVLMTAHCRYGPGTAYLHAADLYEGNQGHLKYRNYTGTWLWVQFDKIHYPCWVSVSVVEIKGDVFSVLPFTSVLPKSTLYGPVQVVDAKRDGDRVNIAWDKVWMTKDDFRGYLIEAQVCQNGFFIDAAYHTDETRISILDERNCDRASSGKLYAVEKHGYTEPVQILWP